MSPNEEILQSMTKVVVVIVVMSIMVLAGFAIVQMSHGHRDPAWPVDVVPFLKLVGKGISGYSTDHSGDLPESLCNLYPQYVNDPRINKNTAVFAGAQMLLTYHKPSRLGDSNVVIVEARLAPNVKTQCHWRAFALYGDLEVHPIK